MQPNEMLSRNQSISIITVGQFLHNQFTIVSLPKSDLTDNRFSMLILRTKIAFSMGHTHTLCQVRPINLVSSFSSSMKKTIDHSKLMTAQGLDVKFIGCMHMPVH